MKNSNIATAIALRDLHCDSLDTIDDRILLQKKVYLAQDLGLPLGYGFCWYIHGPYSSDLTDVAYQIIPEGFDAIEHGSYKKPYADIIASVNGFERHKSECTTQINTVQWYELLASIAYWYKHGYQSKDAIITKIAKTKPQFTQDQACTAYSAYYGVKVA